MPELPEVEVVRTILEKQLKDKIILNAHIFYDSIIENNTNDFLNKIKNQQIERIERYGKYLVFILTDYALISHLRMEGKYYIKDYLDNSKHNHIIFELNDNTYLTYNDTRKFGRLLLTSKTEYLNLKPLNKLAKEPKDINVLDLYKKLTKKEVPIKVALLDQTIIAGLGNIYVDETLFLSNVHPTRKSNTLTLKDVKKIVESAIKVLDKALLLGGTTIRTYTSQLGVTGLFQNELNVHTKKGEPCPICKSQIIKIKVGGRGTYVCENCQK